MRLKMTRSRANLHARGRCASAQDRGALLVRAQDDAHCRALCLAPREPRATLSVARREHPGVFQKALRNVLESIIGPLAARSCLEDEAELSNLSRGATRRRSRGARVLLAGSSINNAREYLAGSLVATKSTFFAKLVARRNRASTLEIRSCRIRRRFEHRHAWTICAKPQRRTESVAPLWKRIFGEAPTHERRSRNML